MTGDDAARPALGRPARGYEAAFRAARPNVARMYDYYLGGKDNFEADREAADKVLAVFPEASGAARANRKFLKRAVRRLVTEYGVRQFIDLGAGLPTMDNTHQVARKADPDCRVVYVDWDEVVLSHSWALKDEENAVTIGADLRDPDAVLGHPHLTGLLDLSRPVGLLALAVLHFIPDGKGPEEKGPGDILASYTRRLVAGSALVISHITSEGVPAEDVAEVEQIYRRSNAPVIFRSEEQIRALFGDGFALVDPELAVIQAVEPSAAVRKVRQLRGLGGVAIKGGP